MIWILFSICWSKFRHLTKASGKVSSYPQNISFGLSRTPVGYVPWQQKRARVPWLLPGALLSCALSWILNEQCTFIAIKKAQRNFAMFSECPAVFWYTVLSKFFIGYLSLPFRTRNQLLLIISSGCTLLPWNCSARVAGYKIIGI